MHDENCNEKYNENYSKECYNLRNKLNQINRKSKKILEESLKDDRFQICN